MYPYLLRGLSIERPNQVWATDICYIPMAQGFMYLVAIMDWYSRRVLAWRVSNTFDSDFCVEALEDALTRYGPPEIFNTDQGAQFTSQAFTTVLKTHAVAISMDGKGRWVDNVFVERLWRSVKYEDVYLHAYETPASLRAGLTCYFQFYTSGLVAASILALSLGYGVTVVAAVLGKRLEVGVFTLVAGVVHVGLAYVFGVQWGLPGIVAATIVSQAFIVVPGLVPHLRELTGLTPTAVATEILTPWLKGFAPVGAVALALGLLVWPPVWIGLPLGAALGGVYLWYTRWLYLEYPPMRRIWQRVTSLGPLARLAIFLGRRRET